MQIHTKLARCHLVFFPKSKLLILCTTLRNRGALAGGPCLFLEMTLTASITASSLKLLKVKTLCGRTSLMGWMRVVAQSDSPSHSHFHVFCAGFSACSSAPGPYFSLIWITTRTDSWGCCSFNLALDEWSGENKKTAWFKPNTFGHQGCVVPAKRHAQRSHSSGQNPSLWLHGKELHATLLTREKKLPASGTIWLSQYCTTLLLKMRNTPGIQLYSQKMTASVSHYLPKTWYQFTTQGKKKSSSQHLQILTQQGSELGKGP